jgi:hypothetical protein
MDARVNMERNPFVTTIRKFQKLATSFSHGEAGMVTAEYAMTTVAACGAAGVLYKILTSDSFTEMVGEIIKRALMAIF